MMTVNIYIYIYLKHISQQTVSTFAQEHRIFWCWISNEEIDRDARVHTTTTRGTGNLDNQTARSLMCLP